MINIVIDPLLIPILILIIAELFRVENRLSKLEERFELFTRIRGYRNEDKH